MKVKSVKNTHIQKPVYDLEVPKYHNFSIGKSGVIVHNCIDAARYALEKFYKRRGN